MPDTILVLHTETRLNYFGHHILSIGDQNGDGYDDMMVSEYGRMWIFFGGPDLDTIPDLIIDSAFGYSRMVGDVNSDGYEDISAVMKWVEQRECAGRVGRSIELDKLGFGEIK